MESPEIPIRVHDNVKVIRTGDERRVYEIDEGPPVRYRIGMLSLPNKPWPSQGTVPTPDEWCAREDIELLGDA